MTRDRLFGDLVRAGVCAGVFLALAFASRLHEAPPFGVSLVWLPAGWALAAAMLWGPRVLVGIWAGGVAYTSLANPAFGLGWAALAQAGTALQALVLARVAGAGLGLGAFADLDGAGTRPTLPSTVARLAAASLIAASLGSLLLVISGANPLAQLRQLWFEWWIGDLIGLLLVGPAAFQLLARQGRGPAFASPMTPLALFLFGMGPLAYLVHELAEEQKATGAAATGAVQSALSLLMLAVFWALAAVMLRLAREQSRARADRERFDEERAARTRQLEASLEAERDAHRQAERVRHRYEEVERWSKSFLWEVDDRLVLRHESPARKVVMRDPVPSRTGQPLPSVLRECDEDDAVRFERVLRQCLADGEPIREWVGRTRRFDGQRIWLRRNGVALRDEAGRVTGVRGISTDVTEQHQAEERARESQKLEAIGQLTGGLAHDFNNLLGVVIGNLDLVSARVAGDERTGRMAATALDAALRAADVTRALLAVARRQPLEVGVHDLNALLEELMPLLRAAAGSAITLTGPQGGEPLLVAIDGGVFSNAALNLVNNARDAMVDAGSASPHIAIGTARRRIAPGERPDVSPGDYAVFEVRDNGPGMSEAVRGRVFEPFFTTKERGRGTGLGLSMVQGYATQLGGTVEIESQPGEGTRVVMLLPIAAAVLEPRASVAPMENPAGDARDLREQALRVLLVDDEAGLRDIAADWLSSMGLSVEACDGVQPALDRLSLNAYDILVTDVVMPGGQDGIALAREAARRRPGLRVLITSGYAENLRNVADLPGQLLSKPYRQADLEGAVRRLLAA